MGNWKAGYKEELHFLAFRSAFRVATRSKHNETIDCVIESAQWNKETGKKAYGAYTASNI